MLNEVIFDRAAYGIGNWLLDVDSILGFIPPPPAPLPLPAAASARLSAPARRRRASSATSPVRPCASPPHLAGRHLRAPPGAVPAAVGPPRRLLLAPMHRLRALKMSAAPRSAPAVPLPSVTFDVTNYREWSTMLEVCLDSQRLWGHLTGSSPRPVVLDRPVEPVAGEDAAPPAAEAMDAYLHAIDQYVAEVGL
ncbi:hypothetical protein U9M48_027261 [Paspalum notatum var. saurae]|uniref:Uncharacterized protein n=1 Tax=Paspalum notatum var. saurae TaxID=547442 RepID=A0AAQ3TUF1_PASNO